MKKTFLPLALSITLFAPTLGHTSAAAEEEATSPASTVITLPDAAEIEKRIGALGGMDHFLEKSDFCKTLGGEKCQPTEVIMQLLLATKDYTAPQPPMMKKIFSMRHKEIVGAVLADHPAVLSEIESPGYLSVR